MRSSKPKSVSAGRGRSKARRRRTRVGAVRAVPKPKGRAEQIAWAENLGFEALAQVHGGQQVRTPAARVAPEVGGVRPVSGLNSALRPVRGVNTELRGSSATHQGGESTVGCCPWASTVKKIPIVGQALHNTVKWGINLFKK